jgi:hypothetical protein
MSIFGWWYPPGAAGDPNAPYNQEDGPCEVCGQAIDDCICPECPCCGATGDLICYTSHGLVRSFAQVALRAQAEEAWRIEAEAINKAEEAAYRASYPTW